MFVLKNPRLLSAVKMVRVQSTKLARIALLLFLLLAFVPATSQPVMAQNQSAITSPSSGESVSGDVPILGSAVIDPFQKYELYYKQEPSTDDAYIWFAGGTQQVSNGQLGMWTAAGLPPGTYSLRLRVVKNDGNYAEAYSQQINLNTGPADTPTPDEPTPSPIPSATFTPAPQPTAIVGQVDLPQAGAAPTEQPTVEPVAVVVDPAAPQAEPGSEQGEIVTLPGVEAETAADANVEADIESNSITRQLGEALSLNRLRTAFFNGIRYSAAIFLVIAVVFLGKWAFGWARARL